MGIKQGRGSSQSDKQVYHAVKDLRAVLVPSIADQSGQALRGYITGMDDYHWVILSDDLLTYMIHKTVPALVVTDAKAQDEPNDMFKSLVMERTSSFREYVLREHFKISAPSN